MNHSETKKLVVTTGVPSANVYAERVSLVNEAGQPISTKTDAEFDGRYLGVFNPIAYGGKGDGIADDTAALQAAINAAKAVGGTVFIPPTQASWRFSTLTIDAQCNIVGAGWKMLAQDPFGTYTYTDGGVYRPMGSVLRSTKTTAGPAITISASGVHLSDFLVLGPGSGTSTGIKLGFGVTWLKGSNVMSVNFHKAWEMTGVLDSTFVDLRARGCVTGFDCNTSFNQNVLVNTEVQFSSADGIVVTDSSTSMWYGGLIQNISGTSGLRHVSGENCKYQGFYFESSTLPTNMILQSAGTGCSFEDWWVSSPAHQITIAGGGSTSISRIRAAGGITSIVCSGGSGQVTDVPGATLTGANAPSFRIMDSTAGLVLPPSANGISVGTGKKISFDGSGANAVGGNNYIRRNNSTGDTEIGSATLLTQVIGVINPSLGMLFAERTAPTAPAVNGAILYAVDNGSGKTQLAVRFATGAVQILATEP